MREKHPIDERFKALYDAEATPPEAVQEALAARMGWSGGSGAATPWKTWALWGAGALFMAASAGHIIYSRMDEKPSAVSIAKEDKGAEPTSAARSSATATGAPAALGQDHSGPLVTTAEPGSALPRQPIATDASLRSPAAKTTSLAPDQARYSIATSLPRSTDPDSPEPAASASSRTGQQSGSISTSVGSLREKVVLQSDLAWNGDGEVPARISAYAENTEVARWMEPLPLQVPAIPAGVLNVSKRDAPYVLPSATWWLGAYAGAGGASGKWTGSGLEPLEGAEQWRGSLEYGVQAGRQWRSGWALSAGLGFALTRSTFSYDEQQQETFLEVDTVWTPNIYPTTEELVYTWNIDSVASSRATEIRSRRATNTYGALRIPVSLSWHGDARRWRYGGFAGVSAWIYTQRNGSTLLREAPDAAPRVVSMEDPRVSGRFAPQVHGHIGLSLGYALTEHTNLFAEPLLSAPLVVHGDAGAALMTRQILQLRLQHEFGGTVR